MGTNYYLLKNVCPHCGTAEDTIHIGKSSGGWYFSLSVDTYDYEEWMNLIDNKKQNTQIMNEDGDVIPVHQMLMIMHNRKGTVKRHDLCKDEVLGVNNLVYLKKNKIHNVYPIQYVQGEFS